MNRSILRYAVLPVLVLSAAATAARAEVTDCTEITAVPTTIGLNGNYCLKNELVMLFGGPAITVLSDGVVIDLNGHTLAGPGTGLLVQGGRRTILRNGSLQGFARAAQMLSGSADTRLEDLHILVSGALPAIESFAGGDVIQRNWIQGGNPAIRANGSASRISDNDLVSVTSGIDIGGANVTVEDNRVSRVSLGTLSFGIRTASGRAILSRNNVSAFSACFDMGSNTRYRENVTNGCTITYIGGVTAGNNY